MAYQYIQSKTAVDWAGLSNSITVALDQRPHVNSVLIVVMYSQTVTPIPTGVTWSVADNAGNVYTFENANNGQFAMFSAPVKLLPSVGTTFKVTITCSFSSTVVFQVGVAEYTGLTLFNPTNTPFNSASLSDGFNQQYGVSSGGTAVTSLEAQSVAGLDVFDNDLSFALMVTDSSLPNPGLGNYKPSPINSVVALDSCTIRSIDYNNGIVLLEENAGLAANSFLIGVSYKPSSNGVIRGMNFPLGTVSSRRSYSGLLLSLNFPYADYEPALTESVTASDTTARKGKFNQPAVAENYLASDALTVAQVLKRTASDVLAVATDAIAGAYAGARSVTDTLTAAAESVVRAFAGFRSESDTNVATDTASRQYAAPRSLSDGSIYTGVIKADNPVAYYRLNDANASSQLVATIGSNLTVNGAVGFGITGALTNDTDTAIQTGSTAYASLATQWVSGYPISIEAWIQPTQAFIDFGLAVNNGSIDHGFGFGMDASSNLYVGSQATTIAIPLNQWTHVVCTVDADQVTTHAYVNGVLAGSPSFLQTLPTGGSFIGVQGSTGRWFFGDVDEVSIYNYPLTAGQVAAHYQAGITGRAESINRAATFGRSPIDTLAAIIDAIGQAFTGARSAVESLSISDVVSGSYGAMRSIVEALATSDAVTVAGGYVRAITDTLIAALDSVRTDVIKQFLISISDTLTAATDSLQRDAGKAILDTLTAATESIQRDVTKVVFDIVATSDAFTARFTGARSVTDTLSGISDSIKRDAGRFVTDSLTTASDAVSRLISFPRSVTDSTVAALDNVVRSITESRALTEALSVSDSVKKGITKSVSDTLTAATDVVARLGIFIRRPTDSSLATDSLAMQIARAIPAFTAAVYKRLFTLTPYIVNASWSTGPRSFTLTTLHRAFTIYAKTRLFTLPAQGSLSMSTLSTNPDTFEFTTAETVAITIDMTNILNSGETITNGTLPTIVVTEIPTGTSIVSPIQGTNPALATGSGGANTALSITLVGSSFRVGHKYQMKLGFNTSQSNVKNTLTTLSAIA